MGLSPVTAPQRLQEPLGDHPLHPDTKPSPESALGSCFCPAAFPGPRQPLCRPRLQDTLSPNLWSRPPRRWVPCRRAWGQLLIPTVSVSRLSQGTLTYQICPQEFWSSSLEWA